MPARMFVASRNPMTSTAPMTTVSTVPRPAAVTSWRRRVVPAARVIPRLSSYSISSAARSAFASSPAPRLGEIGVGGLAGEHRGAGALEEPGGELTAEIRERGVGRITRLQLGEVRGGAPLPGIGQPPLAQRSAREPQRALGIGLHGLLPRTRQLALQDADIGRLHAEAACLVEPAFLLGAVPGDCRIARLLEIRGAQIVHGAPCAGARSGARLELLQVDLGAVLGVG